MRGRTEGRIREVKQYEVDSFKVLGSQLVSALHYAPLQVSVPRTATAFYKVI
jgi:hypothetical protein